MKHRSQIAILLTGVLALVQVACDSSTKPKHYAEENWSQANIVQGGRLYDKWWEVTETTAPTSDFDPIWSTQSTNARTGSATWRCKECHGWDYVGKDGRYSSGSHYTGFAGVWAARTQSKATVFDAIKDQGGDHDLSGVLSDSDVLNLTKFIIDGLIDMSLYIDSSGIATGVAANGQSLFTANCASCHGADGKTIDFDSATGVQGVGWLSNDNPQETLHKIRWGAPDGMMPSMVGAGLTDQQMADILAYAQTLPQ